MFEECEGRGKRGKGEGGRGREIWKEIGGEKENEKEKGRESLKEGRKEIGGEKENEKGRRVREYDFEMDS